MRSRHLLDPELAPIYEQLPTIALSKDRLAESRAEADELMAQFLAPGNVDLTGLKLSERKIPGATGDPDVRVLILEPEDRADRPVPRPGILETHGGGHVMGKPEASVAMYAALVRELSATMVVVDYRLSPETKFPGPLEDCYAALKWMIANADELNLDRKRVGVFGASAGGTLAAGVALLARDRDAIPLAHLHLVQPMLDDRTCVDLEPSPFVGEYGWTRQSNAFGWEARLGVAPGGDGVSPYAAPGRMDDLKGLPSTFISCGALDLFIGESMQFASRLVRAGVPTELHVYPGAPHGAPLGSTGRLADKMARDDVDAWKKAFGLQSAITTTGKEPS